MRTACLEVLHSELGSSGWIWGYANGQRSFQVAGWAVGLILARIG
jgi:hypothetical protein